MAPSRTRRLRFLESLRRTLSEMLHDRVHRAATRQGRQTPHDTSAIYTAATSEDPDLLDQLLLVHQRVEEERGVDSGGDLPSKSDELQRKRMLSAVRATVRRSEVRFSP